MINSEKSMKLIKIYSYVCERYEHGSTGKHLIKEQIKSDLRKDLLYI